MNFCCFFWFIYLIKKEPFRITCALKNIKPYIPRLTSCTFVIYNRFFEIGLFSACRFFFDPAIEDVEILRIFTERRDLGGKNPFLILTPYKINKRETNIAVKSRQIIQVDGNPLKEKDNPECCDILNLVDVLIGAFSQAFDYTSKSRACTEVAEKLISICQRLSETPYNINSRYYKKYVMSFFPKSYGVHRSLHGRSKNAFYKRHGNGFHSLTTAEIKALFFRNLSPCRSSIRQIRSISHKSTPIPAIDISLFYSRFILWMLICGDTAACVPTYIKFFIIQIYCLIAQ